MLSVYDIVHIESSARTPPIGRAPGVEDRLSANSDLVLSLSEDGRLPTRGATSSPRGWWASRRGDRGTPRSPKLVEGRPAIVSPDERITADGRRPGGRARLRAAP